MDGADRDRGVADQSALRRAHRAAIARCARRTGSRWPATTTPPPRTSRRRRRSARSSRSSRRRSRPRERRAPTGSPSWPGAPNLVCGALALRQRLGRRARRAAAARHPLLRLRAGERCCTAPSCSTPPRLALPGAMATVTRDAGRRVGLDDRGEIAPGRRADLVRVRVLGDEVAVARGVAGRGAGRMSCAVRSPRGKEFRAETGRGPGAARREYGPRSLRERPRCLEGRRFHGHRRGYRDTGLAR